MNRLDSLAFLPSPTGDGDLELQCRPLSKIAIMSDSIQALQAAVIRFREQRDWAQFHTPKDLALGLGIEAGELAELFLWKKEEEIRAAFEQPEFRQRLGEELADVMVFLLYLAEASGIDLGAAVEGKIALNAQKYPVEKARGSAVKYTGL
jgi:dCTP diphosphatase